MFALLATTASLKGQAVVSQTRTLLIDALYEKVLSRMDGEEAIRSMFASQHLELTSYVPRKKSDEESKKKSAKVTAKIDITGFSCEYGPMCYLLSVEADDDQAVIVVELTRPVDMLRTQAYRYRITPVGKSQTSIEIQHTLDVVLMRARLKVLNRIIEKATYKQACEKLVGLTDSMTCCVDSLVNVKETKSSQDTQDQDSSDLDTKENSVEENTGDDSAAANEADASMESVSNDSQNSNDDLNSMTKSENDKREPSIEPEQQSNSANRTTSQGEYSEVQSASPDASVVAKDKTQVGKSDDDKIEASRRVVPDKVDEQQLTPNEGSKDKKASQVADSGPKTDATPTTQNPDSNLTRDNRASIGSSKPKELKKEPKTTLRVTIQGVSQASGSMRIAIFNSDRQYQEFDARNEEPKQGAAFRKEAIRLEKAGKVVYEFSDVPFGEYVIAAFHDQDGNKMLNSSIIGMPSEPYGFSRNARGTLGVPKYSDASITYDKSHTSFEFRVR